MIYDKKPCYGDGQWHCPFPREWVERMKRAAKACEPLTAKDIKLAYMRIDSGYYYELPPGDFLDGPQDPNGLPTWMRNEDDSNIRCDIYDYDSIPDIVVSNGEDDWTVRLWHPLLTA